MSISFVLPSQEERGAEGNTFQGTHLWYVQGTLLTLSNITWMLLISEKYLQCIFVRGAERQTDTWP